MSQTAATEYFVKDDKFFIKAFLLDATTNVNGWGVSPTTLPTNIRSFIGKPLVLQDDFNHPMSNDDYEHHLQFQETFRIGNILDIIDKDGIYSAIIQVTDGTAANAFKAGTLPLYVSPQIYHYDVGKEPDDAASGWKGTHLAIVDQPAFGVKKARVVSQCSGDILTCSAQLKRASAIKNKCNCVKQAIKKFNIVTNNKQDNHSSLDNLHENKLVAEDNANVQTIPLEEFEKLKEENASLKLANKEKDTVISELKKGHDDLVTKVASIEKSTRTEKIANILSALEFETAEERQKRIDTLVGSNLDVEEIHNTYKPLLEAAKSNPVKQASKAETKLEYKQGSESSTDSGVPDWYTTFINSGGSLE